MPSDRKPPSYWPSRPFWLLYTGYIFSCVGDRLWTFAIVLLLEHLGGMRLVSANQLVEGISAMFLSTYVGNWLDRHDRKKGALTVLALNNVCVAFSAALLSICLSLSVDKSSSGNDNSALYVFCLVLSIFFCAISKVASEGQKMAFTKDWIVVMAHKDQSNSLSKRNAIMTTIDQMSSVVAPLLTGYILVFGGYRLACLVFVGWNMLSWAAERYLLSKVYEQVKELSLRERNLKDMSDPEFKEEIEVLLERKRETSSSSYNAVSKRASKNILRFWRRMQKTIGAYGRQQVFAAAFGLSLLYMTVLGFDGLAISHGKSQHLPDNVLGIFRSAGSVLGIAGAVSYTLFERRMGVRKTGFIGLIVQQLFLWLCVISIWLPGSPFNPRGYAADWTIEKWMSSSDSVNHPTSLVIAPYLDNDTLEETRNLITPTFSSNYSNHVLHIDWKEWTVQGHSIISIVVFFCGITFARLGLWMADLSITQIMQESIAEEERNTVFGAQNAFCQLFSVLKDIIVILLPDPRTFGLLVLMSVAFVMLGFLFYCYYLLKTRGKTFTAVTSQMDPDRTKLCSLEKDGLLSNSVLPSAPLLTPVLSTRTKQKIICSAQA